MDNTQGTMDSTENANRDATGDAATNRPIPAPGTERSTGGAATAGRGSRDPDNTGGISGVNRRPGEPSAIGPTPREEELERQGQELDRRIEEGICQGCIK